MSLLSIDHVVIKTENLGAACARLNRLGFTVTQGGRHPAWGSRNAVAAFADGSYLELVAFNPGGNQGASDPRRAAGRVAAWRRRPSGYVDVALRPVAGLEAAISFLAAAGLHYGASVRGSRMRPDGKEVRWMMALPELPALPFLCSDVTAPELRVPAGGARVHANGVLGVSFVELAGSGLEGLRAAAPQLKLARRPLSPAGLLEVAEVVLLTDRSGPDRLLHCCGARLRLHSVAE